MVKERTGSLRRPTTTQTARLQRRASISNPNLNRTRDARVRHIRDSLKRRRLLNLDNFPALKWVSATRGSTYDATAMDAGTTKMVYFRDDGGENVYIKMPATDPGPNEASQLERPHVGELAQAALETAHDSGDGPRIPLGRIVIESNNDADRQRLTDQVHAELAGATVVFVRTDGQDRPPTRPPPVPERQRAAGAGGDAGGPVRPPPAQPTLNIPAMTSQAFSETMGEQPKSRSKHETIAQALQALHTAARSAETTLQGQVLANTAPHAILQRLASFEGQLTESKADLDLAVQSYLADSKTYKIPRTTLEAFGRSDPKMDAVRALATQLAGVDVKRLLIEAKNTLITRAFAPLTESDVNPNGPQPVLGEGAGGAVTAKTYHNHNLPGVPGTFLAATKLDGTDATGPARDAGVPGPNPQESLRAVAVYRFDQALGLDLVPVTTFAVVRDAETGELQLGQAIEVVDGTDGQVDVLGDPLTPEEAGRFTSLSSGDLRLVRPPLKRFDGDPPVLRPFTPTSVRIDYTSPIVQRRLADMQIFDNIIGHPDRHGSNFRFTIDATGAITGLKTLDNDDALGHNFVPLTKATRFGLTPPIPPVVDFHTALKVLSAAEPARSVDGLLSTQDTAALVTRLNDAETVLRDRLVNGGFVTSQPVTSADRATIAQVLPGMTWNFFEGLNRASLQATWGDDTFQRNQSTDPTEPVSYLGEIIGRAPRDGYAWPAYSLAGQPTHFGAATQVPATRVPGP